VDNRPKCFIKWRIQGLQYTKERGDSDIAFVNFAQIGFCQTNNCGHVSISAVLSVRVEGKLKILKVNIKVTVPD
jgi:hypothetical protein